VASVVLGFRREDVEFPCRGFGVLVPGIEKFRILGTIFSSSLFPNRAPAGHLRSRPMSGERQPELALLPEEELFETVRGRLGTSARSPRQADLPPRYPLAEGNPSSTISALAVTGKR